MKLSQKLMLKGQKVLKVASKKSPEIMLAAGIVGVIAGVVIACVKTPEAEEVIEEHKAEIEKAKEAPKPKVEKAKVYAKTTVKLAVVYIIPIMILCLSIASIIGAHNIQATRYNQLLAAYFTLDQMFKNYRRDVQSTYGIDTEHEIYYRSQMTTQVSEDGGETFSPMSYGRWFEKGVNNNWNNLMSQISAESWLINVAQRMFNDLLNTRGYVFLNEVYHFLGFDETEAGQQVGWVKDNPNGDGYIQFEVIDTYPNGKPTGDRLFVNFNVDGPILKEIGWKTI